VVASFEEKGALTVPSHAILQTYDTVTTYPYAPLEVMQPIRCKLPNRQGQLPFFGSSSSRSTGFVTFPLSTLRIPSNPESIVAMAGGLAESKKGEYEYEKMHGSQEIASSMNSTTFMMVWNSQQTRNGRR
jgi:hypothetical protein